MKFKIGNERFLEPIQHTSATQYQLTRTGGGVEMVTVAEIDNLEDLLALADQYETMIVRPITGNDVYIEMPDLKYSLIRSFD